MLDLHFDHFLLEFILLSLIFGWIRNGPYGKNIHISPMARGGSEVYYNRWAW